MGCPVNVDIRLQIISKPGALTGAPLGADNDGFVVFANTQSCIEQNFGLLLASACSRLPLEVGNRVWVDTNGDGVQNAEEVGIDGVTVTLFDVADNQIAQKVTANGGIYLFTDADGLLPDTDYVIRLDNATNYTEGNPLFEMNLTNAFQGSDPELDSDAQTVDSFPEINLTSGSVGSSIHRYDVGFTPPATIGDLLWLDVNGNNIQDAYNENYSQDFQDLQDSWNGLIDIMSLLPVTDTNIPEPGLPFVTVSLFGPGRDGVAGTLDDEWLADTETDENGYYLFRPVDPGIPHRVVIVTATLPTSVVPTFDEDGAGDHAITVPALSPGEQHLSADFGYGGNIDLGVEKTTPEPYWTDSPTTTWTITVTNHGTMDAPKVVVGDVLGEYAEETLRIDGNPVVSFGSDVILARALMLAWSTNSIGEFNPMPDYADTADVEAVISDWVDNNISLTGTDWNCTVGHSVNYPYGWNITQPGVLQEMLAIATSSPFEGDKAFVPLVDVNLYWMCELMSDSLSAGATAPPITFEINNELNGWTHDLEGDWSTHATNIRADLYGSLPLVDPADPAAPANQLNTALTGSAFGEEPFDIHSQH